VYIRLLAARTEYRHAPSSCHATVSADLFSFGLLLARKSLDYYFALPLVALRRTPRKYEHRLCNIAITGYSLNNYYLNIQFIMTFYFFYFLFIYYFYIRVNLIFFPRYSKKNTATIF